jgi:hypothetical protein
LLPTKNSTFALHFSRKIDFPTQALIFLSYYSRIQAEKFSYLMSTKITKIHDLKECVLQAIESFLKIIQHFGKSLGNLGKFLIFEFDIFFKDIQNSGKKKMPKFAL